MKFKLIFIILFKISFLQGQSYFSIRGQIFDKETESPIAYAHIYIPSKGLGVVSNQSGNFTLHLPQQYLNESIQFSHLGYLSKEINIKQIEPTDSLKIYMSPVVKDISQIEILATPKPLSFYVQEAVKNLHKRYPNKLHAMTGFLREIKMNSQTRSYDRLIEAALEIQDRSIKSPITNLRIKLNGIRKSNDYSDYSDLYYRLRNRRENYNDIYLMFEYNPIRNYHIPKNETSEKYKLFNLMLNNPEQLSLEDITEKDNRKIYVIAYNGKIFRAVLHIDALDFGIHQLNYRISFGKLFENQAPDPNQMANYIDEDRNILNNTYYYKRSSENYLLVLIEQMDSDGFLNSSIPGQRGGWSYAKRTLMINQHFTKKELKPISLNKAIPRSVELFDIDHPYDAQFWNFYNMIQLPPLDSAVQKELEFKLSLQDQFNKN